jgi:hypothetical protein
MGLPLFPDLPDPEPLPARERAAGLPGGLAALVEAGLPAEVVLRLHEAYRGTDLYVPHKVDAEHPIARALGLEAAEQLCRIAPGMPLCVPKGRWDKETRQALVRAEIDAGVPMLVTCHRYDITSRTYWAWAKKA